MRHFGTICAILKTEKQKQVSSVSVFHVFQIVQMVPNRKTHHIRLMSIWRAWTLLNCNGQKSKLSSFMNTLKFLKLKLQNKL